MAQETGTTRSMMSLILVIILIVVLAWFGWDILYRGKSPTVSYDIISTEDVSTQTVNRGIIHARVQSTTPSMRELVSTALEIRVTDGSDWDMLTLFYYLPGMDANETAYAVARFDRQEMLSIQLVQADTTAAEEMEAGPM